MMEAILMLRAGSLSLLGFGIGLGTFLLSSVPVPPAPRLGHRGAARHRAMAEGGTFALVEPLVRWVAGLVALLPIDGLRERQERELRQADYCLGLTPDEYGALSLLSALSSGAIVAGLAYLAGSSPLLGIPGAVLGFVLPTLQIQEIVRRRGRLISRALPHSIEIAAMCMGAGLDFPGALRLLSQGKGKNDVLAREFSLILEELELGHTRREALLSFRDRVPTEAVRDFVNAVVQAEQKGNPLAKVLQIQGRMLNQRRSVAAEEAAARAGVLLVGPLMLLLCCIMLLLVGPFLVRGVGF